MAYSPQEWETVRAFYERGLSLSEITERDEVTIKSRASISVKAKKEGWAKAEKATLLQKEIQAKQDIADVSAEKATLNATELEVHNTLVDERVKRMEWLNVQALKNVKGAMAHPCENQNDYRARADTISKAKEVVVGRQPETAIQINNNVDMNDARSKLTGRLISGAA
jgi:predicted DNA-binding protein YlxM (UPF0122 family)